MVIRGITSVCMPCKRVFPKSSWRKLSNLASWSMLVTPLSGHSDCIEDYEVTSCSYRNTLNREIRYSGTNRCWSQHVGPRWRFNVGSHFLQAEKTIANVKRDLRTWASAGWDGQVDERKQIFCNRSLTMKSILAVGFDMDYTLAQYRPETFETMTYDGTIQKLVYDLGYPSELLKWKFDWRYMVRGLVLDKRRGNILKMDRHKYVKIAYHGFQELSREDRLSTYGHTLSRESYDEPDYALIDTLFSLAEAYLFAQLVEFKDAFPRAFPATTEYADMYRDVRAAVDLCHRDGTIKQAVAENPSKFIHKDPLLISMLKMLRDSGRITFLVTNSFWDYTHVVMNYLCGTDGDSVCDDKWLKHFDLVITGSAKPAFFRDGNKAPLFEVDIGSGLLRNTDNGTPLIQVGDMQRLQNTEIRHEQACRVYQGGTVSHVHQLLSIEAGAQVLYVGDHIYGDILRSKKQFGWRTMLVVPELESELELLMQTKSLQKEFQDLRTKRERLDDMIQRLEWNIKFQKPSMKDEELMIRQVNSLKNERDSIRELHRKMHKESHERFHPTWGQLMKTGYQNSRFAHQVERFACLYTSQVTNLCFSSPDRSYLATRDFMPHEMRNINK